MASSSLKACFNPDCPEPKTEQLRKGWLRRDGTFAELCDRCASSYEEGRFCDVFHRAAAGWRNCESCRKPVHCGCIVSAHAFVLLDAGGVKCTACDRRSSNMPVPLFERFKDNWNAFAQNASSAHLWQINSTEPINAPSELLSRMPLEVKRSNETDELVTGQTDPNNMKDPNDMKDLKSESVLRTSAERMSYNLNPASCMNASVRTSTANDDLPLQHSDLPVPYRSPDATKGSTRVLGTQPQPQLQNPQLQNAQPLNPSSSLSKLLYANSHNGAESTGEAQMRNGRSRGDARGRSHQLLPRYWPKITDQELQQISGESNALITPLFEKILSASDAGRIGRLVLPKKCAEAYLPSISQPEGIPLKVQDLKGNEWTFQFRFWPNNNSRMYVLEGVTPCIQSMQLQAGDTITFSRLDPEGKLVLGFRKVSFIPPSVQGNTTDPANTMPKVKKPVYKAKEALGAKSSVVPSKRKGCTLGSRSKRLQNENEDLIELKLKWEDLQQLLHPSPDHLPSIVVIEGLEFEAYEEPPILGKPTILVENSFGQKIQWAECYNCFKWRNIPVDALIPPRWTCSDNSWDATRCSCSADQELNSVELMKLLMKTNNSEKTKSVRKDPEAVEGSEGLDTLANLAILGEAAALPPAAQTPTTKHPRHKPGCTCIVCIQPPSGQLPKHSETCMCNACLIVKRRFRTLIERRGKRQLENENETRLQKQHQQQLEKPEQLTESITSSNIANDGQKQTVEIIDIDDDNSNQKKPSSCHLKGHIDLNSQPERDDEPISVSDSEGAMKAMQGTIEEYLKGKEFTDLP